MNDTTSRPLKRALIKEEFVALTQDFQAAVVLGQLEYWQKRVKQIDQYVAEERSRCQKEGIKFSADPTDGWIYKKASQLSDECMLGCSDQTMLRIIDKLVKAEWILKRKNPKFRWDQTLQYRLNLPKIQEDLQKLGYFLSDWRLTSEGSPISKMENADSKMEIGFSTMETVEEQRLHTETTSEQNICAEFQNNKISSIRKITKKEPQEAIQEKFDQFWRLYPEKRSKQQALKIFTKIITDDPPVFEALMNALHHQNRERSRRHELDLLTPNPKHPTTWLNNGCWTDETKSEEQLNEEYNRNRPRGNSRHQAAQRGKEKLDAHIQDLAERVKRSQAFNGGGNLLDF